ncbi:EF hand [Necator americanus]|uniref:EF hand n=1 Tax=Necator americanus TaxID=51031 RepID=W2T077_NECAM|nr:EF hand [Necator americanus]ETN75410.1 EF hand [Necator americanus]
MADLAQIADLHSEQYEALFREANPTSAVAVAASDAAAFLKRSNLNMQQLGQIWELADYQRKGSLDKKGFFIAFKLIAAAQQGLPISPPSVTTKGLNPPHFEGIPARPPMYHRPSLDSAPSEWCISAADQVKYDSIFESLSPVDGKLPGAKVRPVLLNSGLSPTILAKIWELADQDKDGQLDRIEMAVAMHLVYRALQNEPVPAVLPNSLIHPSKSNLSRRTSAATLTSSITGSVPPPVPMPPHAHIGVGQTNYRSRAGSMTSLDGIGHSPRLPQFENRSASVQPNQFPRNESAPATPVRGMAAPLSTSVASSSNSSLEWPVDRFASAAQFAACDTDSDGFVNGNDVKHVLLSSGLPQAELAQVWALSDVNQTGRLNQEQFALIIHLVNMRKRGEDLPQILPPFLVPPSLRVLSVPENGHTSADVNVSNAMAAGESEEMRKLVEEMEKLLADRREADVQVSQLEADMKVKDSQIKNLQVELRTLEVTVKQLERQKAEAGRRLADLDEQIRQLESAALAQAKKAEEAQSRLNQLVEDTQKDVAHAESDQQEIAQLKAELAQLEAERLTFSGQLANEQKGMEAAVDKLTDIERKRQRDEAQRVQLNDAIAHAETVVSDLETVLKSSDPSTALSSKLNLLEDISKKELARGVHHADPFAQTDPFAAAAATGSFAVQFPQDPFAGAAGSAAPQDMRPSSAGKAPPPRPAPPKSSARQTPVNGDPFANTDPFASEATNVPGGFADFSSFGAFAN